MSYPGAVPVVVFRPGGRSADVKKGTLLIDAVRGAGLPIASPCGDDLICGRCGVRILSGSVTREAPVERRAKLRNRVDAALRLACAVRVHDDLEITAEYWGEL